MVTNSTISNNTSSGLRISNSTVSATNNNITGNGGSGGVYIDNGTGLAVISGNYIASNAAGITLRISKNTITGNTIVSNTGVGISLSAPFSTINETITGNTIASNGSDGIAGGSDSTVISGNSIFSNAGHGINLSTGAGTTNTNNLISSNRITDNGGAGGSSGIILQDASGTSTNNQITTNVITDTAGTGFAITIASRNGMLCL